MDKISNVKLVPLSKSKYIHPYRVQYTQDGKERLWDCLRQHDSIAVVVYNETRDTLVLVRQFRPAVYMSANKEVWKDSEVFSGGSLHMHKSSTSGETQSSSSGAIGDTQGSSSGAAGGHQYSAGSEGLTYELCAGIVDKPVSLEQIAKEELLEETGYDVPLDRLRKVTSFWSNIGTAGTLQTLFYCSVTDDMHVSAGGGNVKEGEMIDLVHIPVKDADSFIFDTSKKKSTGMCFGFMWFLQHIRPTLDTTKTSQQ